MTTECHCGRDGHPLHSTNCPVHGRLATDPFAILAELRDGGWRVSVHYDFARDGGTQWVLVNDAVGRTISGHGPTDIEALTACAVQANLLNIGVL